MPDERAEEVLDYIPVSRAKRKLPASSLSAARRSCSTRLECSPANPPFILFDEPAGVAPKKFAGRMYVMIGSLADEGKAVLLVDKRVREAIRVSDTIIVMVEGRAEAMGPGRRLRRGSPR